jgi:hypothetical protein
MKFRMSWKTLVGARGFEPRTSCAPGLTARRINNIRRVRYSYRKLQAPHSWALSEMRLPLCARRQF